MPSDATVDSAAGRVGPGERDAWGGLDAQPVRLLEAGVAFCASPEAGAGVDAGCGAAAFRSYLATDPHNCGACGVDCDGGACQGGACVALPAGMLATGLKEPVSIAVDATSIYWLDLGDPSGPGGKGGYYWSDGRLMKCALQGCGNTPTILAAGWSQGGGLPTPPGAVALDAVNVYWAAGGRVMSCGLSGCGCQPSSFGGLGGAASGVTIAGGSVYFTEYDDSDVGRCPASGCASPSLFATTVGGPLGLAHDASTLYWINSNGDLFSCPLSGCPGSGPTALITPIAAGSQAVAVDDRNIYWTNGNPGSAGNVMSCAKADCGATATVLAPGHIRPMGIAVDATDVYWVDDEVYRCPIGGCGGTPTRVAPGITPSGPIALDATHVYVAASSKVGMAIVALSK